VEDHPREEEIATPAVAITPHFLDDELDWTDDPAPARRPSPAAAVAAEPDSARARRSPLLLVALYAALGIGAIVLTVSLITGAVSRRRPARPERRPPRRR